MSRNCGQSYEPQRTSANVSRLCQVIMYSRITIWLNDNEMILPHDSKPLLASFGRSSPNFLSSAQSWNSQDTDVYQLSSCYQNTAASPTNKSSSSKRISHNLEVHMFRVM